MTLDPFKRLALLTAAGVVAFLLVLVRERYGANAAVFVTLAAITVAVVASIERRDEEPAPDRHRPTVRFGGPPPRDDE